MDTMPIQTVDSVGVRYRGWILANRLGSASKTPIDSEVRAVGRIVVWVDAEAEVSTLISSSTSNTLPIALSPNTAGPIALNTSSELSALARPIPVLPVPAKATAEIDTTA